MKYHSVFFIALFIVLSSARVIDRRSSDIIIQKFPPSLSTHQYLKRAEEEDQLDDIVDYRNSGSKTTSTVTTTATTTATKVPTKRPQPTSAPSTRPGKKRIHTLKNNN